MLEAEAGGGVVIEVAVGKALAVEPVESVGFGCRPDFPLGTGGEVLLHNADRFQVGVSGVFEEALHAQDRGVGLGLQDAADAVKERAGIDGGDHRVGGFHLIAHAVKTKLRDLIRVVFYRRGEQFEGAGGREEDDFELRARNGLRRLAEEMADPDRARAVADEDEAASTRRVSAPDLL